MSWSTSELRVRLAPWNRFKPSSKIFLLTVSRWYFFCGSFMFFSVLCLLCLSRVCLFVPCGHLLGKGWLSFVVSNCEFITFPLVTWVRCGTWLYWFLIFAPLLTLFHKPYTPFVSLNPGNPLLYDKTWIHRWIYWLSGSALKHYIDCRYLFKPHWIVLWVLNYWICNPSSLYPNYFDDPHWEVSSPIIKLYPQRNSADF